MLPAVEVQSLNLWRVREVLSILFKIFFSIMIYHRILNIIAPCAIQSGEGNGTPLQYSCLENPMDGGAW